MNMLKNRISLGIGLLLVWLYQPASADPYHYVNMLVGNRASGLGGAYLALSDDASGCYYNPAGIAFAPTESLSASVNALSLSNKYYRDALTGADNAAHDWVQVSSSLLPNYFGIIKKFNFGMLGFSYAVPDAINRRQKQHFYGIQSDYTGNWIQNYTMNINDSDKTYLLGPSYAYGYSDALSFGATLYVYYRDMEMIRNQFLSFLNGEHNFINYYDRKSEWGCKPILGVMYEPLEKLAVGMTLSKTFIVSSKTEAQEIRRNTNDTDNFGNTNDIYYAEYESDDTDSFPVSLSFGAAYFYSSRLLFAGDISYFDKADDKESVLNLAIGTEYYITSTLALSAGFYTDNANTPKLSSNSYNQLEHVDIYGMTFSISKFTRSSSISLGVAFAYGKGDANVIEGDTTIFDAELYNATIYVSSSYNY